MDHDRANFFLRVPTSSGRAEGGARGTPEHWIAFPRRRRFRRRSYLAGHGTAAPAGMRDGPPRIAFPRRTARAAGGAPAGRGEALVLLGWFSRHALACSLDLPPGGRAVGRRRPGHGVRGAGCGRSRRFLAADEAGLLALLHVAMAILAQRVTRHWRSVRRTHDREPAAGPHSGVLRTPAVRAQELFSPRIDPAIIVLVSDGERGAASGRQGELAPRGRYFHHRRLRRARREAWRDAVRARGGRRRPASS